MLRNRNRLLCSLQKGLPHLRRPLIPAHQLRVDPKLDPAVRRIYVAESQKIRDEFRERKRDWLTIFGGSKAWDQMEQIKADIKLLKDLKP